MPLLAPVTSATFPVISSAVAEGRSKPAHVASTAGALFAAGAATGAEGVASVVVTVVVTPEASAVVTVVVVVGMVLLVC
jgi:hypothetical protein